MTGHPRWIRWSGEAYRQLLRCYPMEFRTEYGCDMVQVHRDRLADAGRPVALATTWPRLLWDTARHAVGERLRVWRARRPPSGRPPRAPRLLGDLRLALRGIRREPGFAVVVIATLALGIGANSAIFTVVNGVLLRPLPYDHGDRLVMLTDSAEISIPDIVDWRRDSRTLASMGAYLGDWAFDWSGSGDPIRLTGAAIEPDVFEVLRVDPVLGRRFTATDNVSGGPRIAILSYAAWQRHFTGATDVLGREVVLSDRATTIIGVMPPEADVMDAGLDLWVPIAVETPWALESRGTNNLQAIGRLAEGATLDESRSELQTITTRLAEAYPATNRRKIAVPTPLLDSLVGDRRPIFLSLLGAVGFVLLLACVNIAGLLLVRAMSRGHEIAVRLALGARRASVARPALTESVLLAGIGAILGLGLAAGGSAALMRFLPGGVPRTDAVTLDGRVVAFTVAVTIATTVVCGLLPALWASRTDPAGVLSGARSSTGRARHRLYRAIVMTEVALCFVVLIGAGLLLRSLARQSAVDLGFRDNHLLTAEIVLPETRYGDSAAQSSAFAGIVRELNATPGFQSAAFVIGVPLKRVGQIGNTLTFESLDIPVDRLPGARWRPVQGDYFGTMGLPILAGRPFSDRDDGSAVPVAIINQTLARRYFQDRSPIGQRIAWRPGKGQAPRWMTIVGVAGDVQASSIGGDDVPAVYTPYLQRDATWLRFGFLVVRTGPNPEAMARAMEEAVWRVDATVPLTRVETMTELRGRALGPARFVAGLVGLFALAAVFIAGQGLYGLLAFLVSERRQELGIRMALGATRQALWRGVVATGVSLAAAGLVLGLAGALVVTRFLRGLLFQVDPLDPPTYAVVVGVLLFSAALASLVPAGRATRADPATALRAL